MSYKKRKPVPERDMFKTRYKGHHTICETLREIYQLSNDEGIKIKCRLAMSMAKSMHERLKKYKKETDERKKEKNKKDKKLEVHDGYFYAPKFIFSVPKAKENKRGEA